MAKLKGFKAREADSLVKRAASALMWLRQQPGGDARFISWAELFAELSGVPLDEVDPEEVKRRLRSKGGYVKAFLRESGHGWMPCPTDGSMLRATAPGEDSALNCVPYYQRRAVRASENFVEWTERTVGDIARIHKTKDNQAALRSLAAALPKHRAIMTALGMTAVSGKAA